MFYNFKLVTLGESGVGKTSIIYQWMNINNQVAASTIGASFYSKDINILQNDTMKLEIWDTAGQERFNSLVSMYINRSNFNILVFDLSDKQSFNSIRNKWIKLINASSNDGELILVGNKADLPREVEYGDIEFLRMELNCDYIEVSSRKQSDINYLFTTIIKKLEFKVSNESKVISDSLQRNMLRIKLIELEKRDKIVKSKCRCQIQ